MGIFRAAEGRGVHLTGAACHPACPAAGRRQSDCCPLRSRTCCSTVRSQTRYSMVESAGATSSVDVLQSIAHLGVLPAGTDWTAARGAIHAQLAQVLAEFSAEGQDESAPMEEDSLQVEPELTDEELCARLEEFEGPPFTIQRLCELLLEPRRQYRRRSKFAFACGKLLTVRLSASSTLCCQPFILQVPFSAVRSPAGWMRPSLSGDRPRPAGRRPALRGHAGRGAERVAACLRD